METKNAVVIEPLFIWVKNRRCLRPLKPLIARCAGWGEVPDRQGEQRINGLWQDMVKIVYCLDSIRRRRTVFRLGLRAVYRLNILLVAVRADSEVKFSLEPLFRFPYAPIGFRNVSIV